MTIAAKKQLPVEPAQRSWDHRKWGTLADPIHKSQLNALVGDFACPAQFKRDRERELRGTERETISGKSALGTAAHETIRRALCSAAVREQLLSGAVGVTPVSVRKVLLEEYDTARAGLQVVWYGATEMERELDDKTSQLLGLFQDLHRHVAAVELAEAGFIAKVGDYWTEGHVDLVYRPRSAPDALALTDWKTGSTKPHPITLDHGFESGLYSAALERGLFLEQTTVDDWRVLAKSKPELVPLDLWDVESLARVPSMREAMHVALRGIARKMERGDELPGGVVRFGRFPEVVRLTHLADYVPYQKAGKKKVERAEELEHWGLSEPGEVKYTAGQTRGPAWYRVRRTPEDVARLEHLLRGVVGMVRMGRFFESVGEKCARCSYRSECLTNGYQLRGDDAKAMAQALKGIDIDGLGEV